MSRSVHALGPALGLFSLSLSALSQTAPRQVTFSIDFHGPTRSSTDCSGLIISEGDILTPCLPGGVPDLPRVPGPLPPPLIALTGGPGGLGIGTHPGCLGTPPGVLCGGAAGPAGAEVDALSYGRDDLIDDIVNPVPGTTEYEKARYHFSVDEFAVGLGLGISPEVTTEFASGDAAADVFVDLGFPVPPPLPPGIATGQNEGVIDGNGRRSTSSFFAYRGTGLIEPTGPGAPPDTGDNLDAVDVDGIQATPGGVLLPAYFSLDSGFIDPRNGFPNSGTAAANGFVGGDVLTTPAGGGAPVVFAPAFLLGLDLALSVPDSDDLDALILFENGTGAFEPSQAPYDWLGGQTDMLLFSVREGSAVIGRPDSIFGLPIQPGDILTTPLSTALGGMSPFPGIFVACENLGLAPSFARMGTTAFGDDLDALDYRAEKILVAQEYCYGDGAPLVAGCTNCPCANDMPAGTQSGCRNFSGTGARLEVSGLACVSNDTLRFEVRGANPFTFAVLLSANNRLPLVGPCPQGTGIAQPALLNGLRCVGGGVTRNGARPTDMNGDVGVTTNGWGPPSGPAAGLIASRGLVACQVRQWQVFYREPAGALCGTGVNTTQAIQVTIQP